MLVRIRSKDGNFRIEVTPATRISDLLSKIVETGTDVDPSTVTISNKPKGNEVQCETLKDKTVKDIGLQHGDLLFVNYSTRSNGSASTETQSETQPSSSRAPSYRAWESVQEDPVDTYWRSQSGKISRSRDTQFCKHGPNGMCDYCMPLEPYDAKFHQEHSIKHLSYHAYLRKLTPKSSSSNADLPPLNPLDYKVKTPCPTAAHPSWPAGICTTCQPSAITLQSQPFRMVDYLEISSMDVIDRFLQAWRKTGLQRFGWLVGKYEPYDKVPMGVKAVVEAICEPPQQGELDGLTVGLPWEDEARIRDLSSAASSPLSIVGYIFTDLDPNPEDRTKTVYKRHPGSFYVSSLEAIFAAQLQKDNPTSSKSSPTGAFASRLVTAVLTANEDGDVDVSAYQVSEQAVAMVDADMIEASVEPGIVRVKEEDRSVDHARYVPDVFYTYKNEYGLEVKKSAKPCFPVEYLLVNVAHGFPQNPSPMFRSTAFSIENRPGLEDQRIELVLSTLSALDAPNINVTSATKTGEMHKYIELAKWLSDWHLITFLGTTGLFSLADTKMLMQTASSANLLENPSVLDPLLSSESWQTLMTFTRESAPKRPESSAPDSGTSAMDEDIPQSVFDQIAAEEASSGAQTSQSSGGPGIRICPHCTFENTHSGTDCEVCSLPL